MTDTPTAEQRAAWQKLADEATPGPWKRTADGEPDDIRVCYVRDGHGCEWCVALAGNLDEDGLWDQATITRWLADATFIAASRKAVPALLAALSTVEAERDRLRERLSRLT